MPLEGLRWSRDSGSALYDTPQNGRSRTGWGGIPFIWTEDSDADCFMECNTFAVYWRPVEEDKK